MADKLEAKIKEIIPRTYNVKSFRLELDIAQGLTFKAGQYISAALKSEPHLKRYLSLSNSPTEKGYLEFTKKITDSEFSKRLNGLKLGDKLIIEYPFGNFVIDENKNLHNVAFLSGGIGITPVRSICKYIADKQLNIDSVLLYANQSLKDIIFREDFEQMQKDYRRLKVVHLLCEPAAGFQCIVGLVNSQVIKNEIPDYAQRKFYICGPPLMVAAMTKILNNELILPKENIITENFQGY